jgi:uncharacterized membrane protein
MMRVLRWLARLDARYRIVVGLAAGMIVFFSLRDRLPISTDGMASWDTFAFFVLVLAWIVILNSLQANLRTRAQAQAQDVSHLIIFIVVIIAASVALLSVGFLLGTSKSAPQRQLTVHLVLTLGTVIVSWAM